MAQARAAAGQVSVLYDDVMVMGGVILLGATLWTDFSLGGYPDEPGTGFDPALVVEI